MILKPVTLPVQYQLFTTDWVTVYNGLGGVFDRGLFEEYTLLEFEGSRFKAFSRWDEFLSKYYGDYMKLPPVYKRRSHHTTAYLKECKEL